MFDPREQSHPAPTFPGANNNAPSIYTVVYASQTLIFISHLTSDDLVLLSRQNGNHNSDFTGLKRFIKHESDYESFFPMVASWLVANQGPGTGFCISTAAFFYEDNTF